MCILCFVQKCTRRVATMLPWLLLPLGILWALSQLLPPGLRFEIGSPQLACVSVLLLTVFWYEFLGPRLSVWRARREDRLRERRRIEAIELQKLRKSALRRCRNCHSPYKDQNPGGGGRFTCSNCGHVSKRPVLEIPKAGSGSGVIFGKDECWADTVAADDDDDRCSAERSYSGVFVLVCRVLLWILSRTRLVWRKVFRGSSMEDLDRERSGSSSRRGEGGGDCQESKGEKARRKAEEKRQARLEKEMLEEEERKQREEVARLVEERRRLRDEKLEAEKKHSTSQGFGGERSGIKEAERRRQEKGKEKDTHGDELDKSMGKKMEKERYDLPRATTGNQKSSASEPVTGNKLTVNKKRYFDPIKGSFLSSSRSFNSATLFGRNAQNPVASATRASKPAAAFVEHKLGHGSASDTHSTGHGVVRPAQGNQSLGPDAQPRATSPKKSWHQLFACASPVSSYPDTHTDWSSTPNDELEVHTTESNDHATRHNVSTENQITQILSSTSSDGLWDSNLTAHTAAESMYPPLSAESGRVSTIHASSDGSCVGNLTAHTAAESMYHPLVAESGHVLVSEDVELFEDPCYIPEPTPLFGPVSPDDFPLEFGAAFVTEGVLKNVGASGDVSKPSPIEPPMSRLRGHEEKHTASSQAVCGPKSQKVNSSNLDDSSKAHEPGTWQMWGTPVVQDAITEKVGRPSGWSFPIGLKESIQESVLPPPQSNMIPKPAKENTVVPAVFSPERVPGVDPQNGLFSPLGIGLNDSAPSIHNPLPRPLPVDGGSPFLPHDLIDNIARNEVMYGIPDCSAADLPFELSIANPWSKDKWMMQDPEDVRSQFPEVPPPPPPMWAFN